MAQLTGLVSSWDLPNFVGELWTADSVPGQTDRIPTFLSLIGGLNGGGSRLVPDMNFSMNVDYDYPVPSQPSISENDSATTLPEAVNPIYTPNDNTCQIYMEAVEETYVSKATRGRLVTDQLYPATVATEFNPASSAQGWYNAGVGVGDAAAIDRQILYALGKIARNVNYTFLNGVYQKATSKAVGARTRGLIPAIVTNAVDANQGPLTQALVNELMRLAVTNSGGRSFENLPVLIMNSYQKQQFSNLMAFQPESRNVAGFNITQYFTDFGPVGIVYEPTIPTDTILLTSLYVIKPVFNEVESKGVLFYEEKAKVAASSGGMLYGHIGLDYGPEWLHGKITNLAVV